MSKIALDKLKKIIREEIETLREGEDHDVAAKQASAASKMLSSIESFKDAASEKVKAELGTHLVEVEKLLARIVASPMQYVDSTKPLAKKVTLKPQKSEVV